MKKEIILIVDDNSDANAVLNQMLASMNYQTLTALDGKSGLQIALRLQPDLVFLDMNMPGMDGLEVLAELRKSQCTTPVIFITAYGSEQIAVEVFRLGVHDYLTKPFTEEEVKAAVDRALLATRLIREREALNRTLIIAESVRATAVTLSHYLNNCMTALNGSLRLLSESLEQGGSHQDWREFLNGSQASSASIEAVIRVLLHITEVKMSSYGYTGQIIDIDAAIQQEFERIKQQHLTSDHNLLKGQDCRNTSEETGSRN